MNSNAINLTTKHKPNTGVFVDERRLLAPPIGEKMRDRSICKKKMIWKMRQQPVKIKLREITYSSARKSAQTSAESNDVECQM